MRKQQGEIDMRESRRREKKVKLVFINLSILCVGVLNFMTQSTPKTLREIEYSEFWSKWVVVGMQMDWHDKR